ncbi:hypothetical protein ACOSP7_015613 [Xanthoceras sorbifolium]|uniref:Late embryogenesis abundant protein LEA-2 subgroup domain-containing protein n=1 Tax=Xanthoceras sorbifolium TaxID=99658 RepID=A0ABQ8I775_9ROSI|nr:hypothetical protein JRO89_XS04G0258600 [Xanthoceras sorbifolium]
MSDRVFPSSKPTANGAAPPATKPPLRPPYRPQPHHRRQHRSRRNYCCCCCFWTILSLLILALVAAIAGTAMYMLYRPHSPSFSIPSLRIHRLNLTSSSDSSSNHLTTLFNFTVTTKNPNSHLTFFYDPFVISSFSANGVFLGNGTLPGYISEKKNQTAFKNVVVSGSNDLDTDSVTSLKSDLKKKSGVSLKIQMDTKVKIKAGKFNTKKLGIRVTCQGFKGDVPKGKSPSLATSDNSKCKVDLRIKIWKLTF